METTEKAYRVINELIRFNRYLTSSLEEAAIMLENEERRMTELFSQLSAKSREYQSELTGLAKRYQGDETDDTNVYNSQPAFELDEPLSILNKCVQVQDTVKCAYEDALNDDKGLDDELIDTLEEHHLAIMVGCDLIRRMREPFLDLPTEEEEEEDEHISGTFVGAMSINPSTHAFIRQAACSPGENDQQKLDLNNAGQIWMRGMENQTQEAGLRNFFINELDHLFWAEKELIAVLTEMAGVACAPALKNIFERQLIECHTHITRLRHVFSLMSLEPEARECPAMAGILERADQILAKIAQNDLQDDVALIFSDGLIIHYRLASYRNIMSLAELLLHPDIAAIIKLTLNDEQLADTRLTEAIKSFNIRKKIESSAGNESVNTVI